MELVDPAAHIIVLALNKLPHFWPQSWLVKILTLIAFSISELYPPISIKTQSMQIYFRNNTKQNYD
jgi:hypothetical protein